MKYKNIFIIWLLGLQLKLKKWIAMPPYWTQILVAYLKCLYEQEEWERITKQKKNHIPRKLL